MLGATFLATLSGCPGGADLEHPEKYFPESTGATGGTGGIGGGSGGMAPTDVPLPVVEGCDIPTVLTGNCATSGCHKPAAAYPKGVAGLVLVPDNGLVGRVKDVLSTHGDIYCGNVPCETLPAECPMDVRLVNSDNVEDSWMLHKLNGETGCGEKMPPAGVTIDEEERSCVDKLVRAIAALP
jgi:hypothetical protein